MATLRKRKLPAEQVVWLAIGMELYRDRPIGNVVSRLDLVLPGEDGEPQSVGKGAISTARVRAGYNRAMGSNSSSVGTALALGGSPLSGLGGGSGLRLGRFGLDYTITPFGELGNAQRISLSIQFGASNVAVAPPVPAASAARTLKQP